MPYGITILLDSGEKPFSKYLLANSTKIAFTMQEMTLSNPNFGLGLETHFRICHLASNAKEEGFRRHNGS